MVDIGKEKCKQLREIRLCIARENGIHYEPESCDNEGPCSGTCPACDREARYIDQCLREMENSGKHINLVGVCSDMVKFTLNDDCLPDFNRDREGGIMWERQVENTRYAILND